MPDWEEFQMAKQLLTQMSPEDYAGLVAAWQESTGNMGEYEKTPDEDSLTLFLLKEATGEEMAGEEEPQKKFDIMEYVEGMAQPRDFSGGTGGGWEKFKRFLKPGPAGKRMQEDINRLYPEKYVPSNM